MILQQITDLIVKKNPGFSGLESVTFLDETIYLSHFAENPKRKIEIQFESKLEAVKYLQSFEK